MRRALSLVEVLVCLALLALVLIPLWMMIARSHGDAVRSHLAFLAVHAAREEIDDLRVLAHLPGDPARLAHDFRPVTGPVAGGLKPLWKGAVAPAGGDYPAEYARILTRLTVSPGSDPRLWPARLDVRWQETGEAAGEPKLHFSFLLVAPRGKR